MKAAVWQIDVDGTGHEVRLEWTYWGGRREVFVDDVRVDKDTLPLRWESTQAVQVAGKPVVVITRPRAVNKVAFDVRLEVDGQELEPSGDTGDDGSDVPAT